MKFACLAALALALAACGGKTFCEDQKSTFDDLTNVKEKDCPTTKAATLANAPKSGTACDDAYGKCSAADHTILQDTLTCEKALPTCTADTEFTTFLAAALACQNKFNSVSANCLDAWKP